MGFPGGSDCEESSCNAGDLGLIPELGRSLEEAMATHSSILAWRIPMDIRTWWATVQGVTQSRTRLGNKAQDSITNYKRFLIIIMSILLLLFKNKLTKKSSKCLSLYSFSYSLKPVSLRKSLIITHENVTPSCLL